MSGLTRVDLLLLRHGIAEDQAPGGSDYSRALTPAGRHKLRDVLEVARRAGVLPSLIVSSPLRRALETAEIAREILGYSGEVLQSQFLKPDSNAEDAWNEVRGYRSEDCLLLVGHEPLFSQFGAYLLGVPGMRIDFKKGALLKVVIDSFPAHPRGVLAWYLTSRLARRRDG